MSEGLQPRSATKFTIASVRTVSYTHLDVYKRQAMNRKIDNKINENDTGKTVEGFLKERGYTHQVLVRLKQTDHGILRNGIWALSLIHI